MGTKKRCISLSFCQKHKPDKFTPVEWNEEYYPEHKMVCAMIVDGYVECNTYTTHSSIDV